MALGAGDDRLRQTQAGGDGQRVAAAGDAVGEAVGGFQRAGVQVNAGVDHAGLFLGQAGHVAVMGSGHYHGAGVAQVGQQGNGEGGTFFGVGGGTEFVNEDEGAVGGDIHDALQVADVAAESGQGFKDALLVADVGVDAVKEGQVGVLGGQLEAGVGHHRQQADGFEGDGFAAGVGAGDEQDGVAGVNGDGGRHDVAGEQRMARASQAQPARFAGVKQVGRDGAEGRGVTALGHGQVKAAQQVVHQGDVFGVAAHQGR